MRPQLALMALLLPLSGCVVPPDQAGYGYPGYPGYPAAGYPGYPPGYPPPGYPGPYAGPDYGYPGFAYYDGSPTLVVDGAVLPLIFYGGGWGYWDSYHNWHRAPDSVAHNLNQRFPGGAGFHAWGGSPGGHPPGAPPPGGGFAGRPPSGPPPGGGFAARPPSGPPPGGGFGGRPPGGPPPGGGRPPGGPPPAAHAPVAAAAGHAPPQSGHDKDEHH